MIESIKTYLSPLVFAIIVMVLSSAATALATIAAGADWLVTAIAVLAGILGPGLWSAPALAQPKPPTQPPTVTP